jgi:hypothetical protein
MAPGPSLNILLCQKIFFIFGGNRTIANISLCQKIFFIYGDNRTIAKYIAASKNIVIYGGNRTIAKYIAASKKIFNNMALVTLTALDSLMAIIAAFNHRESKRTWACPISDSLRPIS